MRISDLAECIQMAKTLSFTQTAKHFYISRSALTKHIASLEQEFDIEIPDEELPKVRTVSDIVNYVEGR